MGVGDAAAKLGAGVYAPAIEAACAHWGIDTPEEQARFLAQITVETANFRKLVESMNYSAEGLRVTFSKARISDADCLALGRTDAHPANQPGIADKLYGGLWGRNRLGNTEPGDGWKYRGRGMAMLTGRDNYRRCGDALGIDFLGHPEMLVQMRWAAQSAGWFWHDKRCGNLPSIKAVCVAWNGGSNALAERIATHVRAQHLLGIA